MVDEQPARDGQPTGREPGDGGPQPQDPWLSAETTHFPRATDDPAAQPADGTAVLPSVDEPRVDEAGARWSARAGVPAAGPRQGAPQEQQWVPDREPRAWWLPILIGVAILVLLGLIGLGLALALRGSGPAPQPSPVPSSPAPKPAFRNCLTDAGAC